MLGMLLAYDAGGNVIATQDQNVLVDEHGRGIALLDYESYESAGLKLRDVWLVDGATGSGSWPEWLGSQALSFRVELSGRRIVALVHRQSGFRRQRSDVEAGIEEAPTVGGARDIRAIVGGPQRPLTLDREGRTVLRTRSGSPPKLRGWSQRNGHPEG